jgi:hypothetical protein
MRKNFFLWLGIGGLGLLVAAGLWWKSQLSSKKEVVVENVQEATQEAAPVPEAENAERGSGAPLLEETHQETASQATEKVEEKTVTPSPETSKEISVSSKTSEEKTSETSSSKESSTKKTDKLSIENRLVDFGYAVPSKRRTIDTIVLHSSYDALGSDPYSIKGIIKEYEEYGVSAHYLIGRDGAVYRLVAEENVSYHAGVSKVPDGRTNVNDFSIGIELVNTTTGKYTDDQYEALKALLASLKKKYDIKYILGHSDIAPDRKTDPWNFDWKRL